MKKVDRAFLLLRDVLNDAFHIECNLIKNEADMSSLNIDHGLREMMWDDYKINRSSASWIRDYLSENSMITIRSNLGFYNILINILYEKANHFILLGPFRSESANALYFERIIQESGVPQERIMDVQSIFRNLPIASLSNVVSTAKRIVEDYFPEFKQVVVIDKKFIGEKHVLNPNINDNQYLSDYWEKYRIHLHNYLNDVKKGNLYGARDNLKIFLDYCKFDSSNPIEELRRVAFFLNDYSAITLSATNVHPTHIFQLQNHILQQIIATNENTTLSYLVYDICHKYVLLIQNHSYDDYSKIVRDIINHIVLHLEEELNLEIFATKYSRNASTLSAQFHKETGTTLVSYIKQVRIRKAIQLLNITEKSISEISIEVGYEDFAYFSRVFKQITGISPRTYKENTRT